MKSKFCSVALLVIPLLPACQSEPGTNTGGSGPGSSSSAATTPTVGSGTPTVGSGPGPAANTSATATATASASNSAATGIAGVTRVFFDDFESGTFALWEEQGAAITNVQPQQGMYAAKGGWDGVVDWNHPDALRALSIPQWEYSTEFLARFWLRLDENVDPKPGAKYFRLPFGNDKEGNELVWADLYGDSTFSSFMQIDGTTMDTGWSCASLADHMWHKAEIYVRDAVDGEIRMWLDDNELHCENSSGFQYPFVGNTHVNAAGWDNFYWPSNWSNNPGWEHDAENNIYLDSVEIFSDAPGGSAVASGSLREGNVEAF